MLDRSLFLIFFIALSLRAKEDQRGVNNASFANDNRSVELDCDNRSNGKHRTAMEISGCEYKIVGHEDASKRVN